MKGKCGYAGLVLLLPLLAVAGATGQDYGLKRSTIDGGGGMFSAGGNFTVSGTIGQADAGMQSGSRFAVTGGFWIPLLAGDCNFDGSVDLIDYVALSQCLRGPDHGYEDPDCACFDMDGDLDVDLIDAATFQGWFSG
jgi:hypothetical protein